MREMHKWKDKVELSLDNRQIFFLFFGLSVVGCFVFALGVMTGRRLQWEPDGQVAALAEGDSLDLLEDPAADGGFSFKEGLSASAVDGLPPTRERGVPPRDEDEIAAEKAALEAAETKGAAPGAALAAADKPNKPNEPAAIKPAAIAPAAPKPAPAPAAKPAAQPTMANADAKTAQAETPKPRLFTLQFKAFSRAEEADKLADKLKANGHEVRVEVHEVRGRVWHRVRMGSFDSWDDALAAKADFEQQEKIIAYVMAK